MKYYDLEKEEQLKIAQIASDYLRKYSYAHGNEIFAFMKANRIGESTFGQLMDAAAKGKGVIAHRLYGHHLLYDFPVHNLKEVAPFLEHLFSDLFTKQGLPIIPGELLADADMLKCCDSIKRSWNFVNGFDILSGTIAIYSGVIDFKNAFVNDLSVDSFGDFIKTSGYGAVEMAIAFSTSNPFMLVGGILSLTSGLKGLLNNSAAVYFKKVQYGLTIEFAIDSFNIEAYLQKCMFENILKNLTFEEKKHYYSFENRIKLNAIKQLREVKTMDVNSFRAFKILLESKIETYKMGINDVVTAIFPSNTLEKIFSEKREKFFFEILELFSTYGLNDPNLSDAFDSIWEKTMQDERTKQIQEKLSSLIKQNQSKFLPNPFKLTKVSYEVLDACFNNSFNKFLTEVKEYCFDFAREQIKDKDQNTHTGIATKSVYKIAEKYLDGYETEQNIPFAIALFKEAADQGDLEAMFKLGMLYLEGIVVEKNILNGKEWLYKAADKGFAEAQLMLGYIYSDDEGWYGDDNETDYEKAAKWFDKAAIQGNAHAQYELGLLYEQGKGVVKNVKLAQTWFQKSAEQGFKDAIEKIKTLKQVD